MIRFRCQFCGQKVRTSDGNARKKGRCPKCKGMIIIPAPGISNTTSEPQSEIAIVEPPDANAPIGLGNIKFCEDIEPDYDKKWYSFLIPKYDELSTFLMGISLILLTIGSSAMRKFLWMCLLEDWRNIILLLMVIGALCICVYHPFTMRKKNLADKMVMLAFAVFVNGGTGIISGDYMSKHTGGWLAIFPAWNMINGIILLAMFRYRFIDERSISERDTNTAEVILGLVVTITIFIICNFVYKLYWAVTLSICIAYATSLSKVFQGQQQIITSQASGESVDKVKGHDTV